MSIHDTRQIFQQKIQDAGYRCTACRMRYCDADGVGTVHRDHHVIEFDVVHGDKNTRQTITTKPVPPHTRPLKYIIDLADQLTKEPV